MIARHELKEFPLDTRKKQISNVVFMGQGEPLYNYRNVFKAIQIMSDGTGMAVGRRKIILSTAGVVPLLPKVVTETGAQLAISLHATTNELRDILVPLNKTYPLDVLMETVRGLPGLRRSRRLTFEYVMLKGVNDSMKDAKQLCELLKDIPCSVNLMYDECQSVEMLMKFRAFNPWPGSGYECSETETIISFSEFLYKKGLSAPIRWSRGKDISAAW